MSTDPFSSASAAILLALRAFDGFTALVQPGNLIDMSAASFERFKAQLQASDTPEVIVLQEAFTLQPFGVNSRVASLSQSFQLVVSQDSLKVTPVNALKYAVMVALLQAGPDLGLSGLVRSWHITQGKDDAFPATQWRRGAQRWVSFLTITIAMDLDRASLIGL